MSPKSLDLYEKLTNPVLGLWEPPGALYTSLARSPGCVLNYYTPTVQLALAASGNCVRSSKISDPVSGMGRPLAGHAQTGSKVVLTPQRVDLSDKITNRVRTNWF